MYGDMWRTLCSACTSSERKAGSPMEAFTQGPMLSMLSHTCNTGTRGSFCSLLFPSSETDKARSSQPILLPQMSRWPTGCPTGPHFHTLQSHRPRLKSTMLRMSSSGTRGTLISGMEANHTCPVDGRFHSLLFTRRLFLERIITENEASVVTNYGNYKVLDILVYPCPCLFPFPVCPCLPPAASPEVFQCT